MYTAMLDTTTTITITQYLQRPKRQLEANMEVLQFIDTTRSTTIIHTTIHIILIIPTTNTTFTTTQSVTVTAMHISTTTIRTTTSTLLMHMFTTTGTAIPTMHMSRARSMIIDEATHSRHQCIKEEAVWDLPTGSQVRITYTNHKE
ncbi:hypothetical protein BGZ82_005709 [Podila clonocystis]|nr:hypothetical protein BGZ82_005709 [Podila clonocystis]